mmetsp:Transcript_71540/g.225922  ORF Transcript_71540/g.225922 Transcript_71540/m.225922 type:complete len:222 (-) Transcript_71540:241-906(-)
MARLTNRHCTWLSKGGLRMTWPRPAQGLHSCSPSSSLSYSTSAGMLGSILSLVQGSSSPRELCRGLARQARGLPLLLRLRRLLQVLLQPRRPLRKFFLEVLEGSPCGGRLDPPARGSLGHGRQALVLGRHLERLQVLAAAHPAEGVLTEEVGEDAAQATTGSPWPSPTRGLPGPETSCGPHPAPCTCLLPSPWWSSASWVETSDRGAPSSWCIARQPGACA